MKGHKVGDRGAAPGSFGAHVYWVYCECGQKFVSSSRTECEQLRRDHVVEATGRDPRRGPSAARRVEEQAGMVLYECPHCRMQVEVLCDGAQVGHRCRGNKDRFTSFKMMTTTGEDDE